MLTIRLEGPYGRWSKTLAPARSFRLLGSSLRVADSNHEVALYRSGCWHRAGCSGTLLVLTGPFSALAVDSPVTICLEDQTRAQPQGIVCAQGIRISNGEIRLLDDARNLFARLDENLDQWRREGEPLPWPAVLLTDGVVLRRFSISLARANGKGPPGNGRRQR